MFGEVTEVKVTSSLFDSTVGAADSVSKSARLLHESGTAGNVDFSFSSNLPRPEQVAMLKVLFRRDHELKYDVTNNEGDGWIGGGVGACLSAAVAFTLGLRGFKDRRAGRRTCWEEGRRDALVINALVEGGVGVKTSVGRVSTVQRNFTSSPVPYQNTTSTNAKAYDYVFRCGGVEDVKNAVVRAERLGVKRIDVVGGENQIKATSETTPKKEPVARLELPHMSRLLCFDPASSTISVESGMTLRTLVNLLLSINCTLPSLPILLDQTVGGCIATGSHGSR